MGKITIRKPYDRSVPSRLTFADDEGRTQQSFKDQCDVNKILDKFTRTGVLEHVSEYGGEYGDFVDAPGYHEAMNSVVEAQQMFEALPAKLRKRFENDPATFLAFMDDPANVDEMRSMGLLPKEVPDPEPDPGERAAEPPATAPEAPDGDQGT